jgi:hypothetical protein
MAGRGLVLWSSDSLLPGLHIRCAQRRMSFLMRSSSKSCHLERLLGGTIQWLAHWQAFDIAWQLAWRATMVVSAALAAGVDHGDGHMRGCVGSLPT